MREYPYSTRDLFAEPENYFFASCATSNYLDLWRESRLEFRGRLQGKTRGENCLTTSETEIESGLSLHVCLQKLLEKLRSGAVAFKEASDLLHPYVVKYEVFKRLFSHYGRDGRRHPESEPASLGTYLLFGHCLAELAQIGPSLKHLSTLLKICDAMASQPAEAYTTEQAIALVELLRTEDALVALAESRYVGPV